MVLVAIMVVATIGCDQATKQLATSRLSSGQTRSYLMDTIRLVRVTNTGGFLSFGSELAPALRHALLSGGTLVALIMLAIFAYRRRSSGLTFIGCALIWAGGISNLINRIVQGSVVDFMNIGLGAVRTGIFNVADISIMVGTGLLLLGSSRNGFYARE